jgi:hypothetical protein
MIAIEGEDRVRMASRLALRSALLLEMKGMRRSRGRSARTIAAELLELPPRTRIADLYVALNKYIVDRLGPEFDRPLTPPSTNKENNK